jgi:Domain of unknown function (DUF1844)
MAEVQKTTQAGEMTQLFIEFVMMHAQNAALFLGQMPDPRGGQVQLNLPLAKMFIDQLTVIREKTKGNLTGDEKKVIDSAVSELQMAFVEVAQMVKAQNINADIPEPLFANDLPELEPEPAAPPATPVVAAAVPQPAAPAPAPVAAPEPPPEEGRKRFTKSYGS